MEKKKLSTQEILARARQQAGGVAGESKADASTPVSEPALAAESAAPASELPAPKAALKPAGDAPKSTKDILAAARAQAAGKSGAAPAAKPTGGTAPQSTADKLAAARAAAGKAPAAAAAGAAPAAVAKAAAPAKPAGDRPSVEEMLRAVREGRSADVSKEAAVVAPPKPVKPAPKAAAPAEPRRNALIAILVSPFALAWTFFTLTSAVAGLAAARFMMPNVLVEPPSKFKVGPPSDYPPGVVSTKWTSQFGVWIVHNVYKGKDLIYALSTVCTHLGCTPNWLEGEQKFKCPCHGSGFYITGVNFEGPAPRPLERHGIRIAEDGMIEVDKSVKFQEEMGQWDDPASFVPVA